MPVLVGDFSFLFVRLHKDSSIADEMRIPFCQDELHCLRVHKGHEPKHSLLLIRDPHILNWPVDAKNSILKKKIKIKKVSFRTGEINEKKKDLILFSLLGE